MVPPDLLAKSEAVLAACRARGLMLATVESCTGGLIAGCLTAVPGCSGALERGFVTYSYRSKTDLVGVPQELLEAEGAVCEEVARAMAEGALRVAPVQVALSVTGVAGPGASEAKPAGRVHMAAALAGGPTLHRRHDFPGEDRDAVRHATVAAALDLVLELVSSLPPRHPRA